MVHHETVVIEVALNACPIPGGKPNPALINSTPSGSRSEIQEIILKIVENRHLYDNLKKNSEEKGPEIFSYTEIAKKAIEIKN